MVRSTLWSVAVVMAGLVIAAPASADSYNLSVTKSPVASAGTVTGTATTTELFEELDPVQIIDCGSDCTHTVFEYQKCIHKPTGDICSMHWPAVRLGAAAAAGWQFSGWTGCSTGTSGCSVAGGANRHITASFGDVADPSVSLQAPAAGTRVRGTVNAGATAGDNWGIKRVEFLLDGALLAVDTEAPYEASFDTTGIAHGSAISVTARAVDLADHSKDSTRALVVDNAAGGAFVPPTPQGFARTATPAIHFTRESDIVSARCRVGTTGPFAACDSPWTTPPLGEGDRTVEVQLTDDLGNEDTLSRGFTVDLTAPALGISGSDGQRLGPGGQPTYDIATSDERSGPPVLACSFDGGAFTGCGSPYTAPAAGPGVHTLQVRARDGAGNETFATRSYEIDATPPETVIAAGPPAESEATTATFRFGAEAGATFRCRVYPVALTPPSFGACSGADVHEAGGFAPGAYAFEVVATDAVGNVDATPARHTFKVLGKAPLAELKVGLSYRWAVGGGQTSVRKLTLERLPVGAQVGITCSGKGCAFKRRAMTATKAELPLAKLFKRKLRAGATIEVRVAHAGHIGRVFRYVTRKGRKFPKGKVLCLAPGDSKPTACG